MFYVLCGCIPGKININAAVSMVLKTQIHGLLCLHMILALQNKIKRSIYFILATTKIKYECQNIICVVFL